MALSYNLAYQEIIFVHPTRRQIFVGKPYFLTLLYFLEHMRPSHIHILDPVVALQQYRNICLLVHALVIAVHVFNTEKSRLLPCIIFL